MGVVFQSTPWLISKLQPGIFLQRPCTRRRTDWQHACGVTVLTPAKYRLIFFSIFSLLSLPFQWFPLSGFLFLSLPLSFRSCMYAWTFSFLLSFLSLIHKCLLYSSSVFCFLFVFIFPSPYPAVLRSHQAHTQGPIRRRWAQMPRAAIAYAPNPTFTSLVSWRRPRRPRPYPPRTCGREREVARCGAWRLKLNHPVQLRKLPLDATYLPLSLKAPPKKDYK